MESSGVMTREEWIATVERYALARLPNAPLNSQTLWLADFILQQLAAAREETFEKVSTAVDLMALMNGDSISANLLKATINRLANRQPGEVGK